MTLAFRASAILLAATALTGCQRRELSGPPDLKLGRHECSQCGMLINEDRCSSASIVDRGARPEHALFDDIGCMLDFESEQADRQNTLDRFVHDHATRAWVPARAASFLMADPQRLATPMGSGIVAFADPQDAERSQKELGGKVVNYSELAEARRAWKAARYGKPKEKP